MRITFLGTSAIGAPVAFCNCENCKLARIHKGKSIRKRSSLLINEDLIIDLGPDTQCAMDLYDKDMGKIKYLLQTHSHTDHFDENELSVRLDYTTEKELNMLEIYAHKNALNVMSNRVKMEEDIDILKEESIEKLKIHTNEVNAGDIFYFGNYKVKAIETTHDISNGSLLYVISENDKNVLYATDTPPFTDNALRELKNIKLDVIIMDHNFGDVDYNYSHLNEKLFIEQLEKLKKINCIYDDTLIYATHLSHDKISYHELAEKRALKNGYHIAYDGMEIYL